MELTILQDGWARLSLALGGNVIFERLLPPESVACMRALCVVLPLLLIAWTVQRWEDYANDPRRK